MYYGQNNQDQKIEEYFEEGYVGNCIDIGATDGRFINNSLHFEELGWQCLCIEPNTNYYDQLKYNRKRALNYAISDFNGDDVDFEIFNIGNNEEAMSSLRVDQRLKDYHIGLGLDIEKIHYHIKVPVRTLDYCLENDFKVDKIDFISIDTEGTELDVLKGLDINRWNPTLIVAENNFNDSFVEEYLKKFNYVKDKFDGINDYYIKKKFDFKFSYTSEDNKLYVTTNQTFNGKVSLFNEDKLIYYIETNFTPNVSFWYSPSNMLYGNEYVRIEIKDEFDNIIFNKILNEIINAEFNTGIKEEVKENKKLTIETFGNLVDKLTIVNLKIWKYEDIKRESDDDHTIAEATRKTNVLNVQRNDLIQLMDEMLIDASKGIINFKNYEQGGTKSYGK